jgi:two-component system phosphate regulon sensor histidine kinase PhoR
VLKAFAGQEEGGAAWEVENKDPDTVGAGVLAPLEVIGERIRTVTRQRDEQKLAGRLAQKRSRHLEAVLRGLPGAAIVTDAMDRIVLVSEAAVGLLRLPTGDCKAVALADCIPDRGLCDLLRGAHCLPAWREVEHCVEGEGGVKRIFSVTIAPLSGAEEIRGAVALLHDVTREQAAARMKTEFVANASHELRTPLGGIKGYLEMLADGEVRDDETRTRFYRVMEGEVDRLSNLVDNILNIARIEAGIVKIVKQNVPLTMIVQEVVDTMQPQAKAAGITLEHEVLPVFFHVYADKEMIRRAVVNLVSNALKYTPQGGTVSVRMGVDEGAGQVSVEVSDTGVGISEQDLPRLFQKFFRVESSKKMAKGTGLGLVLVKEVIESLHGGHVSVQSVEGKGSTFSISLSLVQEKANDRRQGTAKIGDRGQGTGDSEQRRSDKGEPAAAGTAVLSTES